MLQILQYLLSIFYKLIVSFTLNLLLLISLCADWDAVLLNCSWLASLDSTNACNGWIIQSMGFMLGGNDWKCFIFSHPTQRCIVHFTLCKRSYYFFFVASIRLWRVSVWSHGHFYWPSFCPFPHSPLWCCHPCHGTFLLTGFFQVSFMSILTNISSYNKFHSIDCAFKIFRQLLVQSSVIGGKSFLLSIATNTFQHVVPFISNLLSTNIYCSVCSLFIFYTKVYILYFLMKGLTRFMYKIF